jgi:hypothetical protein
MVTIKYEMHKFGLSVMVNVRVQISTGQYIYPISIADQGSDAANEAQVSRRWKGFSVSFSPAASGKSHMCARSRVGAGNPPDQAHFGWPSSPDGQYREKTDPTA